jgi:two-component sensor histidine kinase/tetratricopeptide (TPR) repeat protein
MNFKKLLWGIILLMYSLGIKAQAIDSLTTLFYANSTDSTLINLAYSLSILYQKANLDSSLFYIDESLKIIEDSIKERPSNFHRHKYNFYLHKANLLNTSGRYSEATPYFEKAKTFAKLSDKDDALLFTLVNYSSMLTNLKSDSTTIIIDELLEVIDTSKGKLHHFSKVVCQFNLAKIYNYKGNHQKAIEILIQLLEYPFKPVVNQYKYALLNSLGVNLKKIKNYELAKQYYLRGIADNNIPPHQKGMLLYNIANLHFTNSELDSCALYSKKILQLDKPRPKDLFRANKLLSDMAFTRQNFEKASYYLQAAKQQLVHLEDSNLEIDALLSEIDLLLQTQKTADAAFLINELKSKNITNPQLFESAHVAHLLEQEIALYAHQNNPAELLRSFENYKIVKDSIENQTTATGIQDAITKYESEKKEAENQLLKRDKALQEATIHQQKITLFGIMVGLGLAILFAYLLYRQNLERKRVNQLLISQKEQIEQQNLILLNKNKSIQTLHKELGHRVKNNLAFISTLLRMQSKRLKTPEAKQALKEGEARIEAMSILHRKLYSGESDLNINLGIYLQELCANLSNTFPYSGNQPNIVVSSNEIFFKSEPAIRIGLIVNELVTNSFKYAFSNQLKPQIQLTVIEINNGCKLTYQDNGIGISKDVDYSQVDSMGMKLIYTLTKQLNGTVKFSGEEGTQFDFYFM